MSRPGIFIVLEGLDGAGTTTQAKLLVQWLIGRGERAQGTAQPSPGPIGTFIRRVLRGEQLGSDNQSLSPQSLAALFVADRADHLKSVIEPLLAEGVHVVCDRYVHSSLAYQGAENNREWVAAMNSPMRSPDLTLFVRVSPKTAAQRRAVRGEPQERFEQMAFQEAVAEGYERSRELRPTQGWVDIDGHQPINEIHTEICAQVQRLLTETST